jgi:thiamine biosynthesis lipoprotein ApbE
LGTSLDIFVLESQNRAARFASDAILAEIERLRRIFSSVDPQSELGRLNRTNRPMAVSPEMISVLEAYESWRLRTEGACSAQTGDISRLWKDAARNDRIPESEVIAALISSGEDPGWQIDALRGLVTRKTELTLDLNSIAKGYIIEQAAKYAIASVPEISGLLVNLGGDMTIWGASENRRSPWQLGVQDPANPEENARPLTTISLGTGAVATSGGYLRYHRIGERRFSHLIDPRTGFPAQAIAAATVIAPCSTVANVLATSLCILETQAGLRLVAETPGASCLVVTADFEVIRSPGFSEYEISSEQSEPAMGDDPPGKPAGKTETQLKDPWPESFQVNVALELVKPSGGRVKRPYMAVWAEDTSGKTVRTIAVWGNKPRWVPELSVWWKAAKANVSMVGKVTRATRAPGKYEVVWDGKNDQGEPVPQGTYTIRVEVHREHGRHVTQVGKLACLAEPAELELEKNAEAEATVLKYGKKS